MLLAGLGRFLIRNLHLLRILLRRNTRIAKMLRQVETCTLRTPLQLFIRKNSRHPCWLCPHCHLPRSTFCVLPIQPHLHHRVCGWCGVLQRTDRCHIIALCCSQDGGSCKVPIIYGWGRPPADPGPVLCDHRNDVRTPALLLLANWRLTLQLWPEIGFDRYQYSPFQFTLSEITSWFRFFA